jgi:hypothetical protein
MMSENAPTYELGGVKPPTPPALPGGVVMRADFDSVIDALLADLSVHARNCVRTFGDFQLALDVAGQVEPAVRRLMFDLSYRDFPWEQTRLWMVREDIATGESFEALRGLVVEASGIPPEQVHRIEPSAIEPARAYEATLREHLGWREKGHDRLDYVLMPVEGGGIVRAPLHAEDQGGALVRQEGVRVWMTPRLVGSAHMVALLACGEGARGAIAHALGSPRFPLAGEGTQLRWYVDYSAAGGGDRGAAPER